MWEPRRLTPFGPPRPVTGITLLNLIAICESRLSGKKCVSLDVSEPYGLQRPVTGIALPESYFTTDGQSAGLSWNKIPIWGLQPDFFTVRQLGFCWCGAVSLTRGRVCRLQLLLAFARAVTFGYEPHETCYHILLSEISHFHFRRLLRLTGLRRGYSTPPSHGIPASFHSFTILHCVSSPQMPLRSVRGILREPSRQNTISVVVVPLSLYRISARTWPTGEDTRVCNPLSAVQTGIYSVCFHGDAYIWCL
jgi:hypothetical protein